MPYIISNEIHNALHGLTLSISFLNSGKNGDFWNFLDNRPITPFTIRGSIGAKYLLSASAPCVIKNLYFKNVSVSSVMLSSGSKYLEYAATKFERNNSRFSRVSFASFYVTYYFKYMLY